MNLWRRTREAAERERRLRGDLEQQRSKSRLLGLSTQEYTQGRKDTLRLSWTGLMVSWKTELVLGLEEHTRERQAEEGPID